MANSLVKVSNDSICEAIKFLISETQNHDGSFREVGSIIHGEMVVRANNINSITYLLSLSINKIMLMLIVMIMMADGWFFVCIHV